MPKEIVIAGRNRFQLADYVDAPLGREELRGPTLVTLVSQGTELGWAEGETFPIRPGYAAVFRVEEVGEDVAGVAQGEIRFAMGPHRATQTHAARDTLPVAEGLAPDHAVVARLMGVSMTTLMTTAARPGDSVVVTGAGPVGLLAAQILRIGGFDVTVVDPDPLRRSQAEGVGFADCRPTLSDGAEDLRGRVALVVECSGHERAVLDAVGLVRPLGEVVLVGVPWRRLTDLAAHDLLRAVFFGLVTLRSGWEWQVPVHARGFVWEELLDGYNNAPHSSFGGFERALRWLSEGRVRLDGLLRRVPPGRPGPALRRHPRAAHPRAPDRDRLEPRRLGSAREWSERLPS